MHLLLRSVLLLRGSLLRIRVWGGDGVIILILFVLGWPWFYCFCFIILLHLICCMRGRQRGNCLRNLIVSFASTNLSRSADFSPDAGIFLWTAGLTLFLMGVSWGGTIYPWKSAAVISSIVIGAFLLIVLFVYESLAQLEYPAIPVKFFANRGFMALVCCATVASMFYYSAVLLWPQQVQALYTKNVTYAGWLSVSYNLGNGQNSPC